jgi:hypothetical protein
VAGAIYADMPLADAAFEVGDRGVFETFADLFSLPPKAG